MKTSTLDWAFENLKIPATLYSHEKTNGLLIVFPGGRYSSFGPVLYYPTNLYLDKKYDVLSLEYDLRNFPYKGDRDAFLKNLGLFLFQKINTDFNHPEIHLIAKSIGTNIIAESYELMDKVQQEKIKKIILLTPVWNQPNIMEKLLPIGSKSFHAIGTADKLYDQAIESQLSKLGISYLTIPNADHGLNIEGDVGQSILELKKLVEAISSFIKI